MSIPNIRHLRHGLSPIRTNRRRRLADWIDEQILKFGAAADVYTVASVDDTDPTPATGVLDVDANPTQGETVTIGTVTYTFENSVGSGGGVLIGSDALETITNLNDAINFNGNTRGTAFGFAVPRNDLVTSSIDVGNVELDIEAVAGGDESNNIVTTEAMAGAAFTQGATLTLGTDGNQLEVTGHGLSNGDGPFHITSTIDLPTPLQENTNYWVGVLDVDFIQLYTNADLEKHPVVDLTSEGTGVITFSVGLSEQSIVEHMRQGENTVAMNSSTDLDDFI